MTIKRSQPTLGEDLSLFHLNKAREFTRLRREVRRLEWRSRWMRIKRWMKR